MASLCNSAYAPRFRGLVSPLTAPPNASLLSRSLSILHFPYTRSSDFPSILRALKTSDETNDPALLRKPSIISVDSETIAKGSRFPELMDPGAGKLEEAEDANQPRGGGAKWVDWEDRILEDTVPLVGFVRSILHSGKYESGDRLTPEDEKTIIEKLLPYHPEVEKKIGTGIDFITIGYHPDFENSRCLFIVRNDGVLVDFSFWKCIKGFIRKKYPLFADSFIIRHFRQRQRNGQAPI